MVQTSNHNLDCTDIKALLSALVDDEVEPVMRHDAERHLAGCDSCRALLDEAESLDQLLHDEYAGRANESLPAGFEDSVLSLMRDDHRISAYWRHWTTWAGWCAAAACLVLAASMWITQSQRAATMSNLTADADGSNGANDAAESTAPAVLARGPRRSWTLPAPTELEIYGPPAPSELDRSVAVPASHMMADNHPGLSPDDEAYADAADATVDSLTEHDRSAIYLASIVLDMIEHSDGEPDAVEQAREIVAYDGLLERLARSRQRLAPADRPLLLEAEMVLRNAVHGPLDDATVDLLQQVIAGHNLSTALDRLSIEPRTIPAI